MRKITHHTTKTNKQTPVVNSAGVNFLLRNGQKTIRRIY